MVPLGSMTSGSLIALLPAISNGMIIGSVAGQTAPGIIATNVYVGNCNTNNNPGLAGTPNGCGNGILMFAVNGGTVELAHLTVTEQPTTT